MSKMTYEELLSHDHLVRTDPLKALEVHGRFIGDNPEESGGYFSRHEIWEKLGHYDLALNDLSMAIDLNPHPINFAMRGMLYYRLRQYQKAIEDFDRADAISPRDFPYYSGAHFRAYCHARLGNEEAARADCARLLEDHRGPPFPGVPMGNKQQVTEKILEVARMARQEREYTKPHRHPQSAEKSP